MRVCGKGINARLPDSPPLVEAQQTWRKPSPRAVPLHSGHNAAESSHRQSEDIIFINHCDMIVPVGIPLFCLLLFCMCKYDTYQLNHVVDTCIILP